MTGRLFGTDGVRGPAGVFPVDEAGGRRLGRAVAAELGSGAVYLARDTRPSGVALAEAVTDGLRAGGCDVVDLGVAPTPAVAHFVAAHGGVAGVAVSASHNPADQNGFKLFGRGGEKLTVAAERRVEQRFAEDVPQAGKRFGSVSTRPTAVPEYVDFAVHTLPPGVRLDGLRVVVDCAHGATGESTPAALARLGAKVVAAHAEGDGRRINEACGSLHPEAVREVVLRTGAAIGLAHDGDGDRLLLVDENGDVVDGDRVLGLIADRLAQLGELNGGRVVGTVMSNRGLERWLEGRGLQFHRADVGDRNVWQMMKHHDADLGGEPSGHTILRRLLATDDALLTGLQVLAAMAVTGRRLCDLVAPIPMLPRRTLDLKVRRKPALARVPVVARASAEARRMLHDDGRLVVRYSGTEAVARILVEGPDPALLTQAMDLLAGAFRTAGIAA